MRRRYADAQGTLKTDTARRALLDRIQQLAFAVTETTLYLDGHPYNRRALAYYGRVKRELDEATGEYELNYGPLSGMSEGGDERTGWRWVTQAWPWALGYPETSDRPEWNENLTPAAPEDN
ncbi:MAG: spore coat protein CotJB [Clostridia bacterium]|nr:spore coat protein CotJB [Clostridia bacterium]